MAVPPYFPGDCVSTATSLPIASLREHSITLTHHVLCRVGGRVATTRARGGRNDDGCPGGTHREAEATKDGGLPTDRAPTREMSSDCVD